MDSEVNVKYNWPSYEYSPETNNMQPCLEAFAALALALSDAPSLESIDLRGSPLGKHGITTLAPSLAAAPLP